MFERTGARLANRLRLLDVGIAKLPSPLRVALFSALLRPTKPVSPAAAHRKTISNISQLNARRVVSLLHRPFAPPTPPQTNAVIPLVVPRRDICFQMMNR